MYIKSIDINNYGSIKSFKYQARYNEKGNPIPIILLGKNGSGKSLVLANIVDSLIQQKRELYPQYIPEVKGTNYFKVGQLGYINYSSEYSKVNIEYIHKDKIVKYTDIMSKNPKNTIQNNIDIKQIVNNDEKFKENGFFRRISSPLKTDEYNIGVYLYFPVDRYYVPNWYNKDNYTKVNYEQTESFVGKSTQNIIKVDVLSNIKKWLYDVFLSRTTALISDNQKLQLIPVIMPLHNMILEVFKIIKNDKTITIPNYSYKNKLLPIEGQTINLSDINNLSSGEAMLISIFLSIIKEYDFAHDNYSLQDITGICVIDEIDLNLHISQQKEVLPKLIKMFPRVQFIITTHSPFFVKGMKEIFDDECDFINMPDGHILNDIIEFSEIEKTIEMFNIDGSQYVEYTKELKAQLKKISEQTDKITVLTEGKTDAKFLIKAYEKLGIEMPNIEIRGLEEKTDGQSGDKTLMKILAIQKSLTSRLIAIFDRDNDDILKYLQVDKLDKLTIVDKKVYAFALPIPDHRNKNDKISIEHYFTDEEIMREDNDHRRLYLAKEFNEIGISLDHTKQCKYLVHHRNKVDDIYVLSGSDDKKITDLNNEKNFSLSKSDFCNNVCNDIKNFNNFDFSNFKLLIYKIQECVDLIEQN